MALMEHVCKLIRSICSTHVTRRTKISTATVTFHKIAYFLHSAQCTPVSLSPSAPVSYPPVCATLMPMSFNSRANGYHVVTLMVLAFMSPFVLAVLIEPLVQRMVFLTNWTCTNHITEGENSTLPNG